MNCELIAKDDRMFRLWGKIIKNNRIMKQYTATHVKDEASENEMLDICITEICLSFDIQKPLWFPVHKKDFSVYGRTSFKADAFIEQIDFDAFEIELIREEKKKKRQGKSKFLIALAVYIKS